MSFYIRNLINFMLLQITCHEFSNNLYIKLSFLCHHKIYFMSFYIRNLIKFYVTSKFNFMSYINI